MLNRSIKALINISITFHVTFVCASNIACLIYDTCKGIPEIYLDAGMQPYSVNTLTETEQTVLDEIAILGLVKRQQASRLKL